MRTIAIFIFILTPLPGAIAQCNTFFPIHENIKVFYDHFDRKDKLALRTTQKLIDVTGSGNSMKGTMVQELIDVKKNELITSAQSEWHCEEGIVHFNINNVSMMDPNQTGQGMTMEVSGDKMDIPSSLQVGQTLKDLTYQMKMNMNGVPLMNRTFNVTERKVEAEENVTTPAGSFTCFRVSFVTTSKGGIGGGTTRSIMWYAKDIGLVKAENTSENGKLIGRQLLTRIEK